MKKLKWILYTPLLASLSMGTLIACTQKRPDQWAQGQGEEYLESFPEFNGKVFPLKTGERLGQSTTSSSDHFKIEDGVTEFNNMDFVSYKTTAQLMPDDIEFRGRPNWRYEIMYQVTKNFLKILKVGPEKDIPFQERTYAQKLKDGRLAVPLVGYPIDHVKRVKSLDRNNNETHQWIGIHIQNPEGDSYFRINKKDYVRFEALSKNELFPVAFLGLNQNEDDRTDNDRNWLYAETVLEADDVELNAYQGLNIFGRDSDHSVASKVKFLRTSENELKVVNATSIQGVDRTRAVNLAPILTIPARYVDFRVQPMGSEEDLREAIDERKHYKQRKYVQLNLGNTRGSNIDESQNKLLEVVVGKHNDGRRYFSYTLQVHSSQSQRVRVKFSFLEERPLNQYKKRLAFEDDLRTFGALNRAMKTHRSFRLRSTRDYDERRLITRHGLTGKNRTITFNISEESKRRYLPLARKAFKEWNEALTRGKVNLHLELDETPVALGDIRYNVIHFTDNYYSSAFSGVAANQIDPDTGEIFSTTSIVSMSAPIEHNSLYVRNYIRYKLGLLKKKNLETFLPASQGNPVLFASLDQSAKAFEDKELSETEKKNIALRSLPYTPFTLGAEGKLLPVQNHPFAFDFQKVEAMLAEQKPVAFSKKAYSQEGKRFLQQAMKIKQENESAPFLCSFGSLGTNLKDQIETLCTSSYQPGITPLTEYIKSLSTRNELEKFKSDYEYDKEIIEDCATKISFQGMVATAIHEIGHSIGLDHNFMGSVDKMNFYKSGDTKTENDKIQSSSIMDYANYFDPRLLIPGPYDIATIRFIYDNQVEMKDGSLSHPLNVEKSIEEQVGKANIRPYLFCNDTDAEMQLDPFCNKFDQGTTPLEIVDHLIAQLQSIISTEMYRFDRRYHFNMRMISPYLQRHYISRLKGFYDQWRHLVREKVGVGNEYLERYDSKSFQNEVLLAMQADPQFKDRYDLWRPAAERVMNFFLNEMAFTPNHYCVARIGDGNPPQLFEMSELRESVHVGRDERIESCSHPAIMSVIASRGMELIDEVGHPLMDVYYSTKNIDTLRESIDVVGIGQTRADAMYAITSRSPWRVGNFRKNFYPSMLDEPLYREKVWEKIRSRVLNGIELRDYEGQQFEKYLHEDILISVFSMLFKMGISVPEKPEVMLSRIVPFRGEFIPGEFSPMRRKAIIGVSVADGTATLGVFNTENSETIKFLREYMRLDLAKTIGLVDEGGQSQLNALAEFIKENYPAVTVGKEPNYFAYQEFVRKLIKQAENELKDKNLFAIFKDEFNLEYNFMDASQMQQQLHDKFTGDLEQIKVSQADFMLAQTAYDTEKRKGAAADSEKLASLKANLEEKKAKHEELMKSQGKLRPLIQAGLDTTVRDQLGLNYVVEAEDMLERLEKMIDLHNRAVQLRERAPDEAAAKMNQLFKQITGARLGF